MFNLEKHYRILGLPPNASPRRIKERYRELAKRYHPDKSGNAADRASLARKFGEISKAYRALAGVVRQANLSPRERKLEFLYKQGKQFFDQKRWAQALVVFTEILAIEAKYKDTLTLLQETRRKHKQLLALYTEADQLLQQGQWSAALERLERVVHHSPHFRDTSKKVKKARRELLMQEFLERA